MRIPANIRNAWPAWVKMELKGKELRLRLFGDPVGDMQKRVLLGCARCFVLLSDRPAKVIGMKELVSVTDPPPDTHDYTLPWRCHYYVADRRYVWENTGRKLTIERISQGNLGIEDKLGVWTGEFWCGLKLSGALKKSVGTEFVIWEKGHGDLIEDLIEMPLMKRLEPTASRSGLRRLRRCYAAYLPPVDPLGAAVLAGLLTGAALHEANDETWLNVPDNEAVRAFLNGWGLPFRTARLHGRNRLLVSPLFGVLVAHLMPPHSARRMLAIKRAGDCPYLSAVLWEMALSRRYCPYMPFATALPYGCSKATFFRKGWHRADLHKAGWLSFGIRISDRFRAVLVTWYERQINERKERQATADGISPEPSASPMAAPQNSDS